jgi:hypothetical protein
MGIPYQDIVVGFHSPSKRQFTPYAVGWIFKSQKSKVKSQKFYLWL